MIKSRGQPTNEKRAHARAQENMGCVGDKSVLSRLAGFKTEHILQLCCDLQERAVVRCPLASSEHCLLLPICPAPPSTAPG